MDRSLLDKLPVGSGQLVYIEDHWTEEDRHKILEIVAKLGSNLRQISIRARRYHEAADIEDVRGGIAVALLRMEEELVTVFGSDALWPLSQARDVMLQAYNGKRHWLVTLKGDVAHIPQKAPYRDCLKVFAAAVLDYFASLQTELELSQGAIASQIAIAMHSGGFKVRPEHATALSGRTVQDWRNLHVPGRRSGRNKPTPEEKKAFEEHRKSLGQDRGNKTTAAYFEEVLARVTKHCLHHGELFFSDSDSARKT